MDKKELDFYKFNYIGSKYKLLPSIIQTIESKINKPLQNLVIGDLFSGTAICSYKFRTLKNTVISNDYEYYGYVIARAFTCSVFTTNIDKILEELQNEEPIEGLVYNNMSIGGNRMYFTKDNAMKIDAIRIKLEKLKDSDKIDIDEYYYILTCILLASDKVANITSVYGAYLKNFKKSAIKPLLLLPIHKITKKNKKNMVYNNNINDIIDKNVYDIVYLDPPYNQRQYSKNYHVLNYISLYKNLNLRGVTGLIENSNISLYCKKSEIESQIIDLLEGVKTKWLFMSYNNESLLDKDSIIDIMKNYGNVSIQETDYNRFKSNDIGDQKKKVIEYLFCLEFFKKKESEEELIKSIISLKI